MASMNEPRIPETLSRTVPVPYRENGKFGMSRTFPIREFREVRERVVMVVA